MRTLSIILLATISINLHAQPRKTSVSIKGEDFYINNEITLKGKSWNGVKLEGLLPNSRMVQGIFDDYNKETQKLWIYPDTKKWDPERNTNEFIAAMPSWREHGLLAFTINLQGGSPFGYSASTQNWINSAFREDGSLDPKYFDRLARILDRADELGMVVIVGLFYFGQDEMLKDEESVVDAVRNTCEWILRKGYTNVLIEINNECDINSIGHHNRVDPYDHTILESHRVHELIALAKSITRQGRSLPVSASFKGGAIPTDSVMAVADFILIHGNGVHRHEDITTLIKNVRSRPSWQNKPIVINEDDHFDFDKTDNNFIAATRAHVSWGFFDFRMKDEPFESGYQSVPVDWTISSDRKKAFFGLLRKITN